MARGRRCTAWRSVTFAPHRGQGHVPIGTEGGHACRKCWVPCRNRTDGGAYCQECLGLLLSDPRDIVRLSLARDAETPDDLVRFLAQDGDEAVSRAAQKEMDRRGITEDDVTPSFMPDAKDPWGAGDHGS